MAWHAHTHADTHGQSGAAEKSASDPVTYKSTTPAWSARNCA